MPTPQYWLYVGSRIHDPTINPDAYSQWYQTHHIPDVMHAGSVSSGAFYRSLSPNNPFDWLATYNCDNLDFIKPDNLARIPKKHPSLGTEKSCFEIAEFDLKPYHQIFVLKKDGDEKGAERAGSDRYLLTCSFHCDNGEALRQKCIENEMLSVFPESTWLKVSQPMESGDTYLGYMIAHALGDLHTGNVLWVEEEWRSNLARRLGLEGQLLQPQLWELLKCHET
ncbi:hypothetical protein BO70DRAFT_286825 [Aspergillus heteromorphus CBS 117.55]|uniref:EthD domain-containing protein n=1 Tax=Aspergillus heteromorphus CBS 117.55 TaxID=1448321 RepID=A0A317WP16_9EURO|nr:uncharacterized protein BO70DRAFT_286825 [Aspergillus heteromorphus CBS 117.55]PWY88186.1 hypothetical protein BO70DRAFT_286825 [Aspergillus heteromorphus CBS 117.55]